MFDGYFFKNYIHASDERVLSFFEKLLHIPPSGRRLNDAYVRFAKESDKRDIHIDYYVERKGNEIIVWGKDYTTLHGALYPESSEAPISTQQIKFVVEHEDDDISLVTGYYAENPLYHDITLFVARKAYAIVTNLGARFNADWRNAYSDVYREIEEQLERESGGHEGWTESHSGPGGAMMRSYGFIPNGVHPTTNSEGEVVFTDERPRKREQVLDNVVAGNVLDVISDELKEGRTSHAYQLESGAVAHWDLEIQDMRPRHREIIVHARYWLERPGGVSDHPSNLAAMKFSAIQLTGSEQDSGRVKIIGEISNESNFIRERFDGVWTATVQAFEVEEESATKRKEIASNVTNIYVGNVEGSNVVLGNGNSANITESVFKPIYREIEASSRGKTEKADLVADVSAIESEIAKGERADESFLARRLRNLKNAAPDIAEVALSALAGPGSTLSTIVKKVAQKVKAEAQET